MRRDPIIAEVRAIREDIAREHNYDLNSIFRMLRRHESNEAHVNLSPKRLQVREESSKAVRAAQQHVAADKRRRTGSRTSK
jgi:hypothetical protein